MERVPKEGEGICSQQRERESGMWTRGRNETKYMGAGWGRKRGQNIIGSGPMVTKCERFRGKGEILKKVE